MAYNTNNDSDMKKLAHKFYVTALCLLVMVAVSSTAEAQKKRSTKSKSRTTKVKPKPKAVTSIPVDTVQTIAQTPTQPAIQPAAQDTMPQDTLPPMDGYYKNDMFNNAKAFNYPAITSRDVRFYKRVWRDIDVNDPKNSLFNTPGLPTLGEIIVEGIRTGKLTAYLPSIYNANDSTFAKRLSIPGAMRLLQGAEVAVKQFNEKGEEIGTKMTRNDFSPASLVKFRTKEDVYFDKKRAMVVTRIIGIAPIKSTEAAGQSVEAPVFWLYFPQCRDFFATKDISDPDRNIYDTSLDDVFVQGKYVSSIVRATGSNASRAASQTASTIGTGTAADALAAAAGPDKALVAKQTEEQIKAFKEKTWEYDIKKTPTAAEKKAAAAAAKQAEKAEKDAQKAAATAAKQAAKPVKKP